MVSVAPLWLPLVLESVESLLRVPQLQVGHHHGASLVKGLAEAQLQLPVKEWHTWVMPSGGFYRVPGLRNMIGFIAPFKIVENMP